MNKQPEVHRFDALVVGALVAGVIITSLFAWLSIQSAVSRNREAFLAESRIDRNSVAQRLHIAEEAVSSLARLYHTSTAVNEHQFQSFAGALVEEQLYIKAAYHMSRFGHEQREREVHFWRKEGFSTFEVRDQVEGKFITAPTRDFYVPIIGLNPLSPMNSRFLGFDIQHSEQFAFVANRSVRNADTAAIPVRFDGKQGRLLLVRAIYQGQSSPSGAAERLERYSGLVALEVDLEELAATLPQNRLRSINIERYLNDASVGPLKTSATETSLTSYTHAIEERIALGTDQVVLALEKPLTPNRADIIFVLVSVVTGAFLTLLMGGLARASRLRSRELLARNQEVQREVEQRTRELAAEKLSLEREISQREKAEEKTVFLGRLLDRSSQEFYVLDGKNFGVILVNQRALQNLGYTEEEAVGLAPLDINAVETLESIRFRMKQMSESKEDSVVFDTVHIRKDRSRYPVSVRAQTAVVDGQELIVLIAEDITERRLRELEMIKLSSAVEQIADIVMISDCEGFIEYVNPAFERVTGFSAQEVLGHKSSVLHSGLHEATFYEDMWETISRGETFFSVFINRRKDGSVFHEEKMISPLRDELGDVTNYVSTGRDITGRVKAQEHLNFLAHHDVLTKLPNRVYFLNALGHALKRIANTDMGERVAVLFLDLDRFKIVNDTLGHDVGDQLLKAVAGRLKGALRKSDTVARLGGDEFTIILEGLKNREGASKIANQLRQVLAAPFQIAGNELYATGSLGIAIAPDDGATPLALLKFADTAMYRAKEGGRNAFEMYTSEMSSSSLERLNLQSALHRALERDEFVLYYQPQIDLVTGHIVGVEALLRWNNPERGMVSPNAFIPVLEDTGLIQPVGMWVMEEAIRQACLWRSEGMVDLRVSVNLSGRQFRDNRLVEQVEALLQNYELSPKHFELELTESTVMAEAEHSRHQLAELHNLGIRLAIDDFGTGYSSLAYLRLFTIDTLKIDRSFIRDISRDESDAVIARTILGLAETLGLEVVAEGVEEAEQEALLKQWGCPLVQGYYYSRPVPARQIVEKYNASREQGSVQEKQAV